MSRKHVSIVVDLILDLLATCGLNFRTTVASCSFWMISFFFVLPCCVAVNPVFQKSRCAVHFLMAICFADALFCSFTIPLCVLVLKSWLVLNQDWFAVFLVSCCFSTLHSFFGGLPISQRFFPRSSFQLHVGGAAGNVI